MEKTIVLNDLNPRASSFVLPTKLDSSTKLGSISTLKSDSSSFVLSTNSSTLKSDSSSFVLSTNSDSLTNSDSSNLLSRISRTKVKYNDIVITRWNEKRCLIGNKINYTKVKLFDNLRGIVLSENIQIGLNTKCTKIKGNTIRLGRAVSLYINNDEYVSVLSLESLRVVLNNELSLSDSSIDKIKEIMGELNYPYNSRYIDCPEALSLYIEKRGITKELIPYMPQIISQYIEGKMFEWDSFISKLQICTHQFIDKILSIKSVNEEKIKAVFKLGFFLDEESSEIYNSHLLDNILGTNNTAEFKRLMIKLDYPYKRQYLNYPNLFNIYLDGCNKLTDTIHIIKQYLSNEIDINWELFVSKLGTKGKKLNLSKATSVKNVHKIKDIEHLGFSLDLEEIYDIYIEGTIYEPDMEEMAIVIENNCYNGLYKLNPEAYDMYITKYGITDECYIDIPYIIQDCISGDIEIYWDNFIDKLTKSNYDGLKELYLNKINDSQKLLDVQKLGFNDHRFEHAIINIQRLIKGQAPNNETNIKYGINLTKIKDIKYSYSDSSDYSILYWNRQLFPKIIIEYTRNNDLYYGYDIEEIIGIKLEELKQNKIDYIMRELEDADYDFYHKFQIVIKYHVQKKHKKWRSKDLNVLKYINIGHTGVLGNYEKNDILDSLICCKYTDAICLLKLTKESSSTLGKEILSNLSRLNINKLTVDTLKKWYLKIIVDNTEDRNFNRFLKNEVSPEIIRDGIKMVNLARNKLIDFQKLVLENRHSFTHNIAYRMPPPVHIVKI